MIYGVPYNVCMDAWCTVLVVAVVAVVVVVLLFRIIIYIFNQKCPFTLNLFSLADISQIELKGHLIFFDQHQMFLIEMVVVHNGQQQHMMGYMSALESMHIEEKLALEVTYDHILFTNIICGEFLWLF